MITVRYINNQYEIVESYFGDRKTAKSFKRLFGGSWIQYIMYDKNSVFDRSSCVSYLQEQLMIGIYDYSVELDDPRPMNHGNIISIFAYMLHRSLKEDEVNEFFDVVGPDFLSRICVPDYDEFTLINDAGLPQLIADWGEYKVVFTSEIDTDGFNISLFYAENRVKPSDDKKFGFNQPASGDEDNDGDCHILYREPIYLSPYYPHYWYQMYDYQTKYRHKGHPHGFGINVRNQLSLLQTIAVVFII